MYNDAVDFNRSATLDIGGLYLQDTITEKVKAKFGYNALPNKTIDALTKDGVYKNIQAQDIVNNAKKEMANEMIEYINRFCATGKLSFTWAATVERHCETFEQNLIKFDYLKTKY